MTNLDSQSQFIFHLQKRPHIGIGIARAQAEHQGQEDSLSQSQLGQSCTPVTPSPLNHQPISHTCFPQHLSLGGAVICGQGA